MSPETMHTGCGDPPSATPSCDTSPKLSETTNFQVNTLDGGSTFASETGNLEAWVWSPSLAWDVMTLPGPLL